MWLLARLQARSGALPISVAAGEESIVWSEQLAWEELVAEIELSTWKCESATRINKSCTNIWAIHNLPTSVFHKVYCTLLLLLVVVVFLEMLSITQHHWEITQGFLEIIILSCTEKKRKKINLFWSQLKCKINVKIKLRRQLCKLKDLVEVYYYGWCSDVRNQGKLVKGVEHPLL